MFNYIAFIALWIACITIAATPSFGRWIYSWGLFFRHGIETWYENKSLHKSK